MLFTSKYTHARMTTSRLSCHKITCPVHLDRAGLFFLLLLLFLEPLSTWTFSEPLGQRSKVGVFNPPFVTIASMLNIRKFVNRLLCGIHMTQERLRSLPSAFMDSELSRPTVSKFDDSWGWMVDHGY